MSNQLQQDHYKVRFKIQEAPKVSGEGGVPMANRIEGAYLAGRGAQFNTKNRFLKNQQVKEHVEGIDDWGEALLPTQYLEHESKTIVNKVRFIINVYFH